jgi:hypothetical protein
MKTTASEKTLAEWRSNIRMSLGGEGFSVELIDSDVDHAIKRCLMLFNKYRPNWLWYDLGRITGTYQVTLDVPDGTRVVDVSTQDSENNFDHPLYRSSFLERYMGHRGPRRYFKQAVAADRYAHFLGAKPVFRWNETTKLLMIETNTTANILAKALILTPMTVEHIPFHLEADFLDGCLGYAKLAAARKLRKFGPIPAAAGSITVDYSELQNEGEAAIRELKENLDKNLRHMPAKPIY